MNFFLSNDIILEASIPPFILLNKIKVLYVNAEKEREDILLQNKGKCGVYVWINKLNGKLYVGSAKDLGDKKTGRLNRYFRPSYLTNSSLGSSVIRNAILKYGHNNFMIGILEYTTFNELVQKEHKETIRNLNRNRIFSEESLNKIITKVSKKVFVYDLELKLIKEYTAITKAKTELRISTTTINNYCLSGKVYKNKYRFSFTPLHK